MSVFFEILIMILILGVLVAIHEAGHLGMAKLFNVYCFEYSIGMGPAVLHKKRKGGETYFSIRCVPFGGYVSMYGEAENTPIEEGEQLPPENRSLENVAKWKKVLILFAGVFLNFVLGLILLFMSVSIFPQYTTAATGVQINHQEDYTLLVCNTVNDQYTSDYLTDNKSNEFEVGDYQLSIGFIKYLDNEENLVSENIIVSTDVTISCDGNSEQYVAIYSPSNLTSDHFLANDLYFVEKGDLLENDVYSAFWLTNLPKIITDEKGNSSLAFFEPSNLKTYSIEMKLNFIPVDAGYSKDSNFDMTQYRVEVPYTFTYYDKTLSGLDLKIAMNKGYYDWNGMWNRWAYLVPYCCTAIIQGILSLFSLSGISNLTGVVGMTHMVGVYSAMGGAASIFLFAGLISINLAFFNLLPFPGLDGYQIIVTTIEGITKKKVPNKVKSIVSLIGLGFLILLMVLITIKDIVGLF